MSKSIRIGAAGLTHDHVWGNLEELAALSQGTLVAAADPNQPLLEKVASQHSCATYQSPEEMMDKEDLDAVFVYSDNAEGARLAQKALGRGLHVMIEKPMAATLQGAEAMLKAARESGRTLMINWPFAWWPQLQKAIAMAMNGDLGDLWQVRYRAAHEGPKELGCSEYFCDWLFDPERNGAGALMDYCCYGCALASALLGMPESVTAVTGRLLKNNIEVEDNAVLIMSYPNAIANAEASWTQIGKLTGYMTAIYGTKATLEITPRVLGKLRMASADKPEGFEIEVPAPPAHMTSASAHFLWSLETGGEICPLCRADICRDAQEMLEAGISSSRSASQVKLPL